MKVARCTQRVGRWLRHFPFLRIHGVCHSTDQVLELMVDARAPLLRSFGYGGQVCCPTLAGTRPDLPLWRKFVSLPDHPNPDVQC